MIVIDVCIWRHTFEHQKTSGKGQKRQPRSCLEAGESADLVAADSIVRTWTDRSLSSRGPGRWVQIARARLQGGG
jgi:hypothetical protein